MMSRFLVLFLLLAYTAAAQVREAEGAAQPGRVLYRQLSSVGLDVKHVYRVREAPLDAEDIHLTLINGTIAFSESVEGRITAAFFEGEGELLLVPPDRVERASLALFVGAAILEERFTTAFLRFNDNTFERLQPYLRPAEDAQEFVARWDPACRSLAQGSALQLLESFTYRAPIDKTAAGPGRLLHARLSGSRLGTFDVFLNSDFAEQVSLGQVSHLGGAIFYDVWTSFPMRSARQSARGTEPREASELGRAAVRITRTQVRARIVPPQELHAEATLTLEPVESGVRTLIFELSRYLRVTAVTVDEQPAEFIQNEALQGSDLARRGNDLVAVVLPRSLVAGRSLHLRFRYAGPVMSDAGGGLMYVGARGTWYPSRGPAMSEFDLEFRYPSQWTLLATGKRVSLETADGEQVARWLSERAMPLAGFNLGRYVGSRAQAGGTLVESFASHGFESDFPKQPVVVAPALPGQRRRPVVVPAPAPSVPVAQAQSVAQRSARTVEFLSRRIGPFPYSSLTLSQMPGRVSLGWPSLVFLSSYAFLRPEERRRLGLTPYENILYGELMQAHETAHQWWGDAVFWKSYRDVWLAESLANYSALLELERERPAAFRTVMEEYRRDLLREGKDGAARNAGPVTLGRRLVSSRYPDGYQAVVYGRGTWLLHMLRHLLRDPAPSTGAVASDPDARFFQVLHALRRRFEGRQLSTADLQKAFEEALPAELHFEGKRSLDWFLEGWIQGTALPRFELQNVRFSTVGGKRIARGKLLQKDAPDTLITSVPLYAATPRGNVLAGRVFADGPETEFRLTVPAGSRKLLVDPFQTVLTRP